MAEVTEEQNSEPLDLQRYLNIVRRRHIHFLIPVSYTHLTLPTTERV